MDGYEADDIIGTLASQAATKGYEVYMMTPDKDFGQLVTDSVFLYKPAYMGNAVDVLGPKEVCEKWDIENVSQVVDMLGLQGDTSDNIPGIPGFGPKTAAVLLKKYGSVEGIISHSAELKGKQKELVEQYGDQALLSKKLAKIITDVPVEFDENELVYTGADIDKLKPIFNELEFKGIASRAFNEPSTIPDTPRGAQQSTQLSMFGQPSTAETLTAIGEKKSIGSNTTNYSLVDNVLQLGSLIERSEGSACISIDSVTDDSPNFDFQLTGIAICYREGESVLSAD